MQTLVYIIGGYCLIKAVIMEGAVLATMWHSSDYDAGRATQALATTALMFLVAVEAFNQ